jgi:hypothetical protein
MREGILDWDCWKIHCKYTLIKEVEFMRRRQEELSWHVRFVCVHCYHNRTRSRSGVHVVSAALPSAGMVSVVLWRFYRCLYDKISPLNRNKMWKKSRPQVYSTITALILAPTARPTCRHLNSRQSVSSPSPDTAHGDHVLLKCLLEQSLYRHKPQSWMELCCDLRNLPCCARQTSNIAYQVKVPFV